MSKDPAVLFYTSDFLTGTLTMTDEHIGMYIKLLCLQHQKGRLTKQDMLYVCKTYVEDVFIKFTEENGLYWNERMEIESAKRKAFCESRRLSRTSNVRKTYVRRMENINENEIKDKNNKSNILNNDHMSIVNDLSLVMPTKTKKKKLLKPSVEDVIKYCKSINSPIDGEYFWHHYEQTNWIKPNGQRVINWKSTIRTWEKRQEPKQGELTQLEKIYGRAVPEPAET